MLIKFLFPFQLLKHTSKYALATLLLAAYNKPSADEQALSSGMSAAGDARTSPTFFGGILAAAALVALS